MSSDRIRFASQRIRVSWCAFSFLKAQAELLRMAVNHQPELMERFIFLSGLDFPIADPYSINQELSKRENQTREFVGGSNITKSSLSSARWRINRYHLFRDAHIPHWPKRMAMKLARDLSWALGIRRPVQATLGGRRVDVFTGSDWIGITRDFARRILQLLITTVSSPITFAILSVPRKCSIIRYSIILNLALKEWMQMSSGTMPPCPICHV